MFLELNGPIVKLDCSCVRQLLTHLALQELSLSFKHTTNRYIVS